MPLALLTERVWSRALTRGPRAPRFDTVHTRAKAIQIPNGRSFVGNMFTIDGLDTSGNIVPDTAHISPNPVTVAEISIWTNSLTVEEGKTRSIHVANTTKSGTNSIHWTGSCFFSNQNLLVRTIFTNE